MNNDDSVEPVHSLSDSDYETTATLFTTRINNSDIVTSFNNVSNIISSGVGTCPLFSMVLPAPINKTIATTIHCDLFSSISVPLSVVTLAMYTFIGFRIVASA